MCNVRDTHRIHVVNVDLVVDLESFYAQITAHVSGNDVVSNGSPLMRSVKVLIDPSVVAERRFADLPL